MDDTIYRQDAIDAFDCTNELIVGGEANAQNVVNYINKVVGKIKDLPSAQQELNTALYADGFSDGYKQGKKDAQQEIIRCKDCEHFHYDMPYVIQGLPVLGHEVCDFWGGGCKTAEDGFCSYAERRNDG